MSGREGCDGPVWCCGGGSRAGRYGRRARRGGNGALYGTTYQGGTANDGTVFRLTPPATSGDAWKETVLYHFSGGKDGGEPQAPPLLLHGMLYGTTSTGGATGHGTVFKLVAPG